MNDNVNVNSENSEELDNIITLRDDDGNDVEFEFLDLIEYCSEEYVVLLPLDDEEGTEVVILNVLHGEDEDAEDEYVSVEDAEILDAVFEIFKERFKDEFSFQ